jgi:hypothetical protein
VFLSHTSELREFPRGASYVAAAERAVSAAGHVIVDMADFPAADQVPAQLCADRVRGCDVYVGILGTRYGSPVRDMPQVSYTELEFDTATEAELDRLVFVLDTDADDTGIPVSRLIDQEFGARQEAFRRRVQDSGLTIQSFANPDMLRRLVERSLRELAEACRWAGGGTVRGLVPVVVGDVPQEPAGFQPRADLLAGLDAAGRGTRVVRAVTGMRGVGKTQLAAAYARARIEDGWRLVAWVNAEDKTAVLGGLAEVAAALGLDAGAGDTAAAARAVRHWLEASGQQCLLVLDNAADPASLLPFLPAAGNSRVLITSNERAVAELGAGVPVDVFTQAEALAFLAGRTGSADTGGARLLAAELGRLPLALAQAAAVIAAQHLDYGTYLARLRATPVEKLLRRTGTDRYPHGLAAAVLLGLDAARAADETGVGGAVMHLTSVLSATGVPRTLLHTAGQAGALGEGREAADGVPAEVVDEAVGGLAGSSLLTFSVDGAAVTAHRLVMRVIRERLARQDRLAATCQAAAAALQARAWKLEQEWQDRRPALRDLVEQILAVQEHAASCPGEAGGELTQALLGLRGRAVWFLNRLGDSAAQAIQIGDALLTDYERVLGPDHPDTLRSGTASPTPTGTRAGSPRRSRCTSGPWPTGSGSCARTTPTPCNRGTTSLSPTGRLAGRPRRSRCMSGPWRAMSESWARTTPALCNPGTTSPPPTWRRAGRPRRSRCTSGPWPTGSGSWARTTPTPWAPGTTSPWPTRPRAGPARRFRCTSGPWPTTSGCWARTTPAP